MSSRSVDFQGHCGVRAANLRKNSSNVSRRVIARYWIASNDFLTSPKTSKAMNLTTKALILLMSTFGGSSVEAQTVYAIIACPTIQSGGSNDNETNHAGALSAKLISQTLSPLGDDVKLIDLTGIDYSGERVLNAISSCPAGPSDTIFVYVMGHGSYDPSNRWTIVVDNNMRSGRRLVRGDLTRALRSRDVRLGVLVTESCAGISNDPEVISAIRRIMTPRVVTAYGDQPESPEEVMRRLFLKERGTVDLAASEVTQFALFNADGPFFLRSLCATLNSNTGNGSWEEVFSHTKQMLSDATKGQQKPVAISLPANTGANRASLGISAKAIDAQVILTKILPNTPASRIGLEVNDIIERINHAPISTTGELLEAVKRSPETAELVINRDGNRLTFFVRLSR